MKQEQQKIICKECNMTLQHIVFTNTDERILNGHSYSCSENPINKQEQQSEEKFTIDEMREAYGIGFMQKGIIGFNEYIKRLNKPAQDQEVKTLQEAEKPIKITFGLTPNNIEIIEKYLATDYGTYGQEWVWKVIGREIGWCSETACRYYINHLNKILKSQACQEDLINACKYGYEFHATTSFPDLSFEDGCKNNFLQVLSNKPHQASQELPDIYSGELNTKRIKEYQRLTQDYNILEGTVRDIFSSGADWYKAQLIKK